MNPGDKVLVTKLDVPEEGDPFNNSWTGAEAEWVDLLEGQTGTVIADPPYAGVIRVHMDDPALFSPFAPDYGHGDWLFIPSELELVESVDLTTAGVEENGSSPEAA